jgi:hypothetical protein
VLGGAFVIVGAPRIWEARRADSFGSIQPHHTTNNYMAGLLQAPDGSERLQQALSTLPQRRPIAVILPETNEESIFVSYLLTYFSWPREVRHVPIRRDNAISQMSSLDREALAAIFFCGIDPPGGMQPVIRIGSGLVMVTANTAPEESVP